LRWHGWTSRLSVGQGFFAPTPLTEETEAAGLTRLIIPKPLLAERGRSASFDVTRNIGPASLTVTLFDSSVRHPINVERRETYQLVNLAQPTHNAGVEFLGPLRKAAFSATASYTYVRSRQFDFGERGDTPLTPRHSFGLVGMWEKEKIARIGVEIELQSYLLETDRHILRYSQRAAKIQVAFGTHCCIP
jgi:iron complex outermembrane receptor protein